MISWWYIHTATLYQLSCRGRPDDIYIPQLYIDFSADEHLMIYTYRNFIPTFLHKNMWWYIHTVTLHQLSCRWTPYDIYILQLYINFTADEHLMIFTYRNFIPTFLHTNTWWYIHTATLYQFSCSWTRGNIYGLQRFFNFPADEQVWIYSCGNFISFFVRWRRDDRYFCRSFISSFL